MNIGELATVAGHKLPIKIFMLNNQGHAMCRQTQREWLNGTYPSTSIEGGLTFPDFRHWAAGCEGFRVYVIEEMQSEIRKSMKELIKDVLFPMWPTDEGRPTFCEVRIHPDHDVIPKVKYGYPNEDGHPLLPRDEFNQQMIVKTWIAS
jgi:acetolactate synthase-1/2/3 large subunit